MDIRIREFSAIRVEHKGRFVKHYVVMRRKCRWVDTGWIDLDADDKPIHRLERECLESFEDFLARVKAKSPEAEMEVPHEG